MPTEKEQLQARAAELGLATDGTIAELAENIAAAEAMADQDDDDLDELLDDDDGGDEVPTTTPAPAPTPPAPAVGPDSLVARARPAGRLVELAQNYDADTIENGGHVSGLRQVVRQAAELGHTFTDDPPAPFVLNTRPATAGRVRVTFAVEVAPE